MNVTFHAPSLGRVDVPLGFDGPGELIPSIDGVKLSGRKHSQNLGSLVGMLGFFVGVVLAAVVAALLSKLGIDASRKFMAYLAAGAFFVGLFATIHFGRKLFPPKQSEVFVPWASVKKLGVDPDGAHAMFVSKAKPRGAVLFTAADATPSQLVDVMRRAALASGVQL